MWSQVFINTTYCGIFYKMTTNFREHEEFKPSYDDEVVLPLPVVVFGVGDGDPFLGVGNIIGSIEVTGLGEPMDIPVIEVLDISDGQPYTLMGWDCNWTSEITEEMIKGMASGALATNSVKRYLEAVEREEVASELADADWLMENEIDPDSL